MFSYEERMAAVQSYIDHGCNLGAVMRELGYPSPVALRQWYKEYMETGDLKKSSAPKPRFTQKQIDAAVDHYFAHGQSYVGTSLALGYPCRIKLAEWVKASGKQRNKGCKTSQKAIKYSDKEKQEAVLLWASGIPDYKIAAQYGVCSATIYGWRKKFLGKDHTMNRKRCPQTSTRFGNIPMVEKEDEKTQDTVRLECSQLEVSVSELQKEKAQLQKEVERLRFEQDVIETTIRVLKKAEGINLETLTNREKVDVIDVLKSTYRLNVLINRFKISKSSYFYAKNAISEPDKYGSLREIIQTLFEENHRCYGYRRIHSLLKKNGQRISEKVVRRLMSEGGLTPYRPKQKKYSSYVGEIDGAPKNLVARDFHAEEPNALWLTDITEFALPAGKVYLSPIIDCFDGMAVSWKIGRSPSAALANTMLEQAIDKLPDGVAPIIHSDRGGHYRWPKWVEIVTAAKLTRSMSKKGCSPDNAACEGFFGRLKNEMFYGRSWIGVSIDAFIAELDDYLHWYNEGRIKLSLGSMSPRDYRQKLGLM